MDNQRPAEASQVARFGRRKVAPRVCIADGKKHIRRFLEETLEDLGFITCECAQASDLDMVLDAQMLDLVVLGLSAGGVQAGEMLKVLAAKEFKGKVLLLAPRASIMVAAIEELGESLGIAMLSPLTTPFDAGGLRKSVATLLPLEAPPSPPVNVAEAKNAGWLELWYQPKINAQTLVLGGVEGLVRIRHPSWGIVPPAYFIPDEGDPNFRVLSEFVIERAVDDWRYFCDQHRSIEIATPGFRRADR